MPCLTTLLPPTQLLSTAPGALNLALPWAQAHQQFVHLLSLVPDCLEAYQSEDAWGGTLRRWAILNDTTTVQIDASVHPSSPQAKRPAVAAAAAAAGVSAAGSMRGHQPAAAAAPAAAAPHQAAALPRALQSELDFLQKRYGMRVQPAGTADVAESTAGAATQLAGLSISPAAASAAAPAAGCPTAAASAAAAGTDSQLAFHVSLRPTDPAWDPAHPLLLCGLLQPGSYPAAGSLNLAISPAQRPELSALQHEVLGKLLQQEVAGSCGRPGALRAVLRHLENHAGELWQASEDIAAEVARRRQQAQQAGTAGAAAAAAAAARAAPAQAGSSSSGSDLDDDGAYGSYGSSSDDGSSGSSLGSEGEDGPGSPAGGGGGHSDAVLPLRLELEGLELVDCDALELLRLNLQVACTRCRAPGELSFATAAVALPSDGRSKGSSSGSSDTLVGAGECGNCHQLWAAEVAPKLLHERSNTLAHIRAEGCAPVDLLPSWLAGQCGRCSSSAAFRSVAVGKWNERACSACHTPMRFQFSTALFVAHKPGGGRQQGAATSSGQPRAAADRNRPADGGAADPYSALLVQPGTELPERGTCKHYRLVSWCMWMVAQPPPAVGLGCSQGMHTTEAPRAALTDQPYLVSTLLQAQLPLAALPLLRQALPVRLVVSIGVQRKSTSFPVKRTVGRACSKPRPLCA